MQETFVANTHKTEEFSENKNIFKLPGLAERFVIRSVGSVRQEGLGFRR